MKALLFYLCLAPLIPFGSWLAVSSGSPWWTHLSYMFGHAGWLHYILNGLGWAMMHRIATPGRTTAAILIAAVLPSGDIPVLGWSVVLYYYMGLCLASLPTGAKVRLLLLVGAGFFVPWIAAGHHALMLIAGWLIRKVEIRWDRTMY